MGVYLVSVDAADWRGTDEGGYGEIASAFDDELRRRGLPPFDHVGQVGRSRSLASASAFVSAFVSASVSVSVSAPVSAFEEKLSPSMLGFAALCRARLTREEEDLLCDWSVLVPVPLERTVELPIGSAYTDTTVVAGAPQVLALAQRLASVIGLPPELPVPDTNLALTSWFLDGAAKRWADARPGPWSADLDTAFYVALYRRAAQHALSRGCPLTFC
ncbi:hypothetical protein ACIPSE_27590 [Streptomyces sp. NPDC090106]|uniref:hypothetical protein n=1 Tax=Streptomyces sp. NPDC090106 TaxID=3365946 RepID=UPI00381CF821